MKKRAIMLLCLVQFVDVMGVTELVTAMPRILASLHASASAAGPTLTAYAMSFGGLLMLGARLGDRFGHRRALLLGLTTFAAGSLLAATAEGPPRSWAGGRSRASPPPSRCRRRCG